MSKTVAQLYAITKEGGSRAIDYQMINLANQEINKRFKEWLKGLGEAERQELTGGDKAFHRFLKENGVEM